MSQAHQNARSSGREDLPDSLRIYGLEGITQTQDEAIAQHAVTLAEHHARLAAHDTQLAVTIVNQTALQKSMDAVVSELVKTRWTLIAFALSGIGIAIGLK